jgi:hypothetical protein
MLLAQEQKLSHEAALRFYEGLADGAFVISLVSFVVALILLTPLNWRGLPHSEA